LYLKIDLQYKASEKTNNHKLLFYSLLRNKFICNAAWLFFEARITKV